MTDDEFVNKLKQHFNLERLPVEGGLFTQTYKSSESIPPGALPERYPPQARASGTAIIYLMTTDPDCFSALHQLPTDEVYHFYLGDPLEMLLLYPDGHSEHIVLGQDILNGQKVQFVARCGVWQGSHLMPGGRFALIGTTLAPGYEDSDYRGGERQDLIRQYPHEEKLIRRLTR